jgi:GT2 family glycosyltransferase/glycosyltransferase involved in cell wall biosynthesis
MTMSGESSEPQPLPVSILIPAYGAEAKLHSCLESIAEFLPAGCDVYVLDDASPGDGIAQVVTRFLDRIPTLHHVRRPTNLGFVENCNEGMLALRDTGRDILLLNSDTKITVGALEEMYAVLHMHDMHGVVTPRSNRATIYSVPVFERFEPDESYALWSAIKPFLKRYQVMPTAVGFCMLIRNSMLHHFGVFDPIYSPGYNEENDLVCRMNRRGYSAVAANWAFVFHFEGATFGDMRNTLEARNRAVLDERYPEYARSIGNYFRFHMDPVDRFAAVWASRKKKILFDLYHLTAMHSGTSEFGISLLLHLAPKLSEKYELIVGLTGEGRSFFDSELIGYPIFDEARALDVKFDLAFKPCQLFSWQELHRLTRLAARICFTHQDSIAIRCRYLTGPSAEILHGNLPQLVDRVITISRFSKSDFEAFYGYETDFQIVYQGVHKVPSSPTPSDGYLLIAGNHYEHKAVDQAVAELKGLGKLVVLGGAEKNADRKGAERHVSGYVGHSDVHDLFANAAIVIYPSYYEGFGLPIFSSLALGRHVVALDTQVSRELLELTNRSDKLHLAKTHRHMRPLVESILEKLRTEGDPALPARSLRSWNDVAVDYAAVLDEVLNRPVDVDRMRLRWNWLSAMDSYSSLQ